jgi:hypothetical protein
LFGENQIMQSAYARQENFYFFIFQNSSLAIRYLHQQIASPNFRLINQVTGMNCCGSCMETTRRTAPNNSNTWRNQYPGLYWWNWYYWETSSSSDRKVTCSHHQLAENCIIWR